MLPPSAHFSGFSSEGTTSGVRGETSRSTARSPISAMSELGQFGQAFSFGSEQFSHDLGQMMDVPQMNIGHRRAQSDPVPPNKLRFVGGPSTVGASNGSTSSEENMIENDEDPISMYMDMDKLNSSFGLYGFEGGDESAEVTPQISSSNDNVWESSSDKPIVVKHQQSLSLDGSTSVQPKLLISGAEWTSAQEWRRKARSAAKLLEIALADPKRARRIWANRQSAARSKERKMRYLSDLEKKVKTLEIEAASLSAQLALVKRDTIYFTAENDKLKVHLQSLEQQIQLQDAINNALKEEVQQLQLVAGTVSPIGEDMTNNGAGFNANQQLYPYNNSLHTLITDQQLHQLQIRPLQPSHVQHQPSNVMRNKGPTPSSQKGPHFNSSSME